ncbi:hypothetical protein [Streptomyces sp. NPDC088757]|uniref:hypothetical protein n=1 Tax=Streptomyces sp. NPDC088757 TaxID=3365889 RepID=UPI0038166779
MTTGVVLAFGSVSGLLAEVSFVAMETLGAEAGHRMGDAAHRAQAAQTGIDQGAILLGPLLGGLLLLTSPTALLTVVALLSLTAAATAPGHVSGVDHQPTSSSLRTGWTTLRRTPALVWLVGGLAASNLATGVLQAAAPITVVRHFHSSTPPWGRCGAWRPWPPCSPCGSAAGRSTASASGRSARPRARSPRWRAWRPR